MSSEYVVFFICFVITSDFAILLISYYFFSEAEVPLILSWFLIVLYLSCFIHRILLNLLNFQGNKKNTKDEDTPLDHYSQVRNFRSNKSNIDINL